MPAVAIAATRFPSHATGARHEPPRPARPALLAALSACSKPAAAPDAASSAAPARPPSPGRGGRPGARRARKSRRRCTGSGTCAATTPTCTCRAARADRSTTPSTSSRPTATACRSPAAAPGDRRRHHVPDVNGRSMQVPLPEGTLTQWRDPAGLADAEADMRVDAQGADAIDGQPAKKYLVHVAGPPAEITLWIGEAGLPLQIVSAQPDGTGDGPVFAFRRSFPVDRSAEVNEPVLDLSPRPATRSSAPRATCAPAVAASGVGEGRRGSATSRATASTRSTRACLRERRQRDHAALLAGAAAQAAAAGGRTRQGRVPRNRMGRGARHRRVVAEADPRTQSR